MRLLLLMLLAAPLYYLSRRPRRADGRAVPRRLLRYPPGPLSLPVGQLNPAIQEYHYLAHRGVHLGPWANAICYLDAWAAGDEDGKPYLEQHLPPANRRMEPKLFSPLFVTGEPEWGDYTVEVVGPAAVVDRDMAGVVFRYHTNRHHYLFCAAGRQAGPAGAAAAARGEVPRRRLAGAGHGRLPLRHTRYYRLKVETRGDEDSRLHRRQAGR